MVMKQNNGKHWRAERFVASLLVLTSFGAHNTGYTVRYAHPNFDFVKTSYNPIPLVSIAGNRRK